MTTSHLIELPTQLILADTPLLPDSTNEVLTHAKDLGKPTSRVYISHGHPDHFAGAGLAGAPLYALPSVAAAINNGGGAIIRGALALTGHGRIEPGGLPRIGHHVAAGEERIDGARVRFERVAKAESSEQRAADDRLPRRREPDRAGSRLQPRARLPRRAALRWLADRDRRARRSPLRHGPARPRAGPATAACTAPRAPTSPPHPPSVAEADGPDDLNRYLATAFPGYGGTTIQPLQNYFLYPGNR